MIARGTTVIIAGLTAIVAALAPDAWASRRPVGLEEVHGPLGLPVAWLGDLSRIGGLLGVLAVLIGTLALARPQAAPRIVPAAATALVLGVAFLVGWLAAPPAAAFCAAAYVATAALGLAAAATATLAMPPKPKPDPRLELLRDVLTRAEH